MSRLTPGQRLWPKPYNSRNFEPPVIVESVGRTVAKVRMRARLVNVPADANCNEPGAHRRRDQDWLTTYYTDAGRLYVETEHARHVARQSIVAHLAGADLPTLNRVLTALGLPEVTVWTPPENE